MSEVKLTEFQKKVYRCTKLIPRGKVSTYKLIAEAIGSSGSFRAVGSALKKNPYAPKVPCHRVVCSDGTLGGFMGKTSKKSAEIKKKIKMLQEEGISVADGEIDDFDEVVMKPELVKRKCELELLDD